MAQRLLDGLRVLDLGGDPSARAARVLGDLGADVVRVVPPAGDRLARQRRPRVERRASRSCALAADDPALDALLADADVVFDELGAAGTHQLDPARAPQAVWVRISPFGRDGPRAAWRASDLGVMAASREHVLHRRSRPRADPLHRARPAYAHSGPRGRVRGDDRAARAASRNASTSRCRRSCSSRTWPRPRSFPEDRRARQPARRQHRPHPRDLADARRLRLVRAARRQGAGPEPRDPHQARRRRRRPRRRAHRAATGTTSTRTPRPTRSSPRSRRRSPSTSSRHTMQELYDIAVRDQPDARAGQLAARDLRSRRSSRRATSSARSATSRASRSRSWSRAPPATRSRPCEPVGGARAVERADVHARPAGARPAAPRAGARGTA